jgi:hypothetical protein
VQTRSIRCCHHEELPLIEHQRVALDSAVFLDQHLDDYIESDVELTLSSDPGACMK